MEYITVVAESSETSHSGSTAPWQCNVKPGRRSLRSTWQLILNLSLYYTICSWHKRIQHILVWYLTLQDSCKTVSEVGKKVTKCLHVPGVCRDKFSIKPMNLKFHYPFTGTVPSKALFLISQFYICSLHFFPFDQPYGSVRDST